jgi:opacity protein-like surface antigen
MKTLLLAVFCFFVVIPCAAFAESNITVEFEGRYWFTDLTAEVKVTQDNIGSDIDLQSDLGVGNEDFPEGRFTWYTGPNSRLRLAYMQIDYSGDKELQRTLEFDGGTYPAGARAITDFEVKYLRFGWIWQFVNLASGKVKFGTLLEAKGISADATLKAPDVSLKKSDDLIAGLPTIGIAFDISPLDIVNFFGEVSGMTAGKYGYFFDAEAGIKIIPIRNLSILGGYRYFDIKAKDDTDFAKVRIAGPFVGATARF